MGQSTASLLVSLSLYIMVLSSNQKGECWQKKKKKKHKIIFLPFLHFVGLGLSREILIASGQRRKIISWKKVKI